MESVLDLGAGLWGLPVGGRDVEVAIVVGVFLSVEGVADTDITFEACDGLLELGLGCALFDAILEAKAEEAGSSCGRLSRGAEVVVGHSAEAVEVIAGWYGGKEGLDVMPDGF